MLSSAYVHLAKLAAHPTLQAETRRLLLTALVALERELETRPLEEPQYLDCEPTDPSAEPIFDFDDEPTKNEDDSTKRMVIR
jgi:hypothetical protein